MVDFSLMPTVLITGFGAFPGNAFNPTGDLVARLAVRRRPALERVRRIVHVFSTSYDAVDKELPELVASHRPDAILMFGLAGRTPHLRVETRARNKRSSLLPDVSGAIAVSACIRSGAAATLRTSAPCPMVRAAAGHARVPVKVSIDAGTYVCNYLYWRALESARDTGTAPLVLFVHVPRIRRGPVIRRTARRPQLSLTDLERAGEAILLALVAAISRR